MSNNIFIGSISFSDYMQTHIHKMQQASLKKKLWCCLNPSKEYPEYKLDSIPDDVKE